MMKSPLLASIVLFPCLTLAKTSPTTISPEVTQELEVMTSRLKLTQTQQDKIRPILATESDKKKDVQDKTNLSDKQKHDQIGAIHRAALQQIKAVFTPEQLALINEGMNHPSPTSSSSTKLAK